MGVLYWLPPARRLLEENQRLSEAEQQLHKEVAALELQRAEALERARILAAERDEMFAHARRLESERDEANQRITLMQAEVERHKRYLWAPPGHFYSPVVDPTDPHVQQLLAEESRRFEMTCPDVAIDEDAMLDLARQFSAYYPEVPFPEEETPGRRYYFNNASFSYADAITLFCMLRHYRPKRLVEVGVGFSSAAFMDTNDAFFSGQIDATFIDPFPETLLSRLSADDVYRSRVLALTIQSAPRELFAALDENDILFLDTSHVSKTASDVNYYLFHILPFLKKGVIIHIHDIIYPFEYPARWTTRDNRSWNEAFVLRAFLAYNDAFRVIFFNDLMYLKHRAAIEPMLPLCLRNSGSSLWMRKQR